MLKRLAEWLNPSAIRSPEELAEMIGTATARVAQQATTGYCRTKAGSNVDLLFKEQSFLDALETCRWGAFGLVLADICLVAEGYLRPAALGREDDLAAWLTATFDAELDRHARPEGDWTEAKAEFRARLARARLAAPIPAGNVGFDTARQIFDSLPVHPRLRREDFEVVQNLARFGHVSFRADLERRCDAEEMVAALPRAG